MKRYIELSLSYLLLTYVIYAEVTGDRDLTRLRERNQKRFTRLRRWWWRFDDKPWKRELRLFAMHTGWIETEPVSEDK